MSLKEFPVENPMSRITRPKISIIIVNYNGSRYLENCLKSLKESDFFGYEIILVDNNSTDKSLELVEIKFPKIKIIKNKDNLGFSKANNQGASLALGDYLFFLNFDTKLHPKTLNYLVKALDNDDNLGVAGCQTLTYDGKDFGQAGIGIDIFGFPLKVNNNNFYIEGSGLFIRKSLFEKLNGFDKKYFMFHEDIDLCWRARLLGYKIMAVKKAILYHAAGATTKGIIVSGRYQTTFTRRYLCERNNLRTLLKNYSSKTLFFVLPVYLLINFFEISLFILIGNPRLSFCYFKSFNWNLKCFPDTLKQRESIQKTRIVSDDKILKNMYLGSAKLAAIRKLGLPFVTD